MFSPARAVTFADPNFKFIVLSSLIHGTGFLKKELEEMKDRLRDDNDMSCEPIPEIRDFLLRAEVTAEQLEGITELWPDGGDEAYFYMMNYWDGEDDQFCIDSLRDIVLLPNLETIQMEAMVMENSLDLEPLLQLKKLKKVNISEYFRQKTAKNGEVLAQLRARGVEVAEG